MTNSATSTKFFRLIPVPKPRMTRRDRWKKRPAVVRYYNFKDEIRIQRAGFTLPASGAHFVFYMPIPANRKNIKPGDPHLQKPDVDNLTKAFLDALMVEDCTVWDLRTTKIYSDTPGILIRWRPLDVIRD